MSENLEADIVERLCERFNESWMPEPNSGCWLWLGSVMQCGPYESNARPRIGNWMGHRVSWKLHRGPIPGTLQVLHKCDVPLCVNPAHLWLGTNADNCRDRAAKGRTRKMFGVSNGVARLTEESVRVIRASEASHRELGRHFKVSEKTIRLVRQGLTWGYVQ